jgi:hypothetical protein
MLIQLYNNHFLIQEETKKSTTVSAARAGKQVNHRRAASVIRKEAAQIRYHTTISSELTEEDCIHYSTTVGHLRYTSTLHGLHDRAEDRIILKKIKSGASSK